MDPLSLFTLALGFPAPWEIVDVAFDPKSGRIDFHRALRPGDTILLSALWRGTSFQSKPTS